MSNIMEFMLDRMWQLKNNDDLHYLGVVNNESANPNTKKAETISVHGGFYNGDYPVKKTYTHTHI
jgi:pyruvate dehydrogenase complex dehydrogenase (E1) component